MSETAHDYDGIREDRQRRPPLVFTLLFYGLILWGVLFAAYFLLSGWSSEAEFAAKMAAHQEQVKAHMEAGHR